MEGRIAAVEAKTAVLEAGQHRLEKTVYGNGQPGLESKLMGAIGVVEGRLKGHIESVERHTKANMEQGDSDLLHELESEREARQEQHKENQERYNGLGKKIDRLTWIVAAMMGGLSALKVLEDIGMIHVVSK